MISVLLPISDKEDQKLIKLCLESLANQTYKDFEVLIVTSKGSAERISQVTKKYPFVKTLGKDLNKTAARNFAAKHAKGEYLLHLDTDMELPAQVLLECAEKTAEAIIIPLEEAPHPNFWSRCRAFEKNLFLGGSTAESPIFIKKSLFEKIGGYDEDLDPLDDWDLHLTLKALGIKFGRIQTSVLVRESTSFKETLRRKYERGRAFSAFREKHPHPAQLNLRTRLEDYRRNWKKLIKAPHLSLGLFVLKVGDVSAFFWGVPHPLERSDGSSKKPYTLAKVAGEYDQKRLGNNFVRYKHFAELRSVFRLLPEGQKILEVGCGTGRVTAELVKRGYKVSPIDNSPAMLAQYKQKLGLPRPRLTTATRLPFPNDSFPVVFSLRVIWHLVEKEEREAMLSETARVSSSFIIFDIANKKRFLAKLLMGPNTYPVVLEDFLSFCQKRNLQTETTIPLDVTLPIWLNLLPQKLAEKCFPLLYRLDLVLAKIIPPGRYLLKLKKPT